MRNAIVLIFLLVGLTISLVPSFAVALLTPPLNPTHKIVGEQFPFVGGLEAVAVVKVHPDVEIRDRLRPVVGDIQFDQKLVVVLRVDANRRVGERDILRIGRFQGIPIRVS
ncbi:hypothetical protein IIB97_02470, partial [Patescibacteria group bacterium]|nr:hypothetical protein [Patescibacteria group bacterium]